MRSDTVKQCGGGLFDTSQCVERITEKQKITKIKDDVGFQYYQLSCWLPFFFSFRFCVFAFCLIDV